MLSMKAASAGVGLCVLVIGLFGCSHTVTGEDGSKATIEPNGKIVASDNKGNTATITDNGSKIDVQSKDGASHYEANNGTVKAHDSKGNSMEMGTGVSEAELGVPFYPGSAETKDSIKSVTDKGSSYMSIRTTSDEAAKVIAFYTGKIGKPTNSLVSDSMSMANWKVGKKSTVLIVSKEGGVSKISITVGTDK